MNTGTPLLTSDTPSTPGGDSAAVSVGVSGGQLGGGQVACGVDVLAIAGAVLKAESRAVEQLAARLGPGFVAAVELLGACARRNGAVLVTGLGKSGLVGAKISATLASLGVPSHFIHPVEAAHGDLGNFRSSDLCIALSNSGETEEVLSLVACLRQDGIQVIGICAGTPGGTSRLERQSSVALTVGEVDREFGGSPAPMCSTTAMMAMGDALALCASKVIEFTQADFAKRHPGGSLGGLMKPVIGALRFVVGKNLVPVADDLTVEAALRTSETSQRRPGAMLLVDRASGRLTGIFTDADLRRLILGTPGAMAERVGGLMTRNPTTLPHTARLMDAVAIVREFRRDEIPVVDELGRPLGILDVQDLIAMRLVDD